MDWDLLDRLTADEAKIVLQNFLEVERKAIEDMSVQAARNGVIFDFTIGSLLPVFWWLIPQLKRIRIEPPLGTPDWLLKHHEEVHGWFDFDEPSKILCFRAGYYMGETFVRSVTGLEWGIGNPDYVDKNKPVVTGFARGMEMAPTRIAENLLWRVIRTRSDDHAKNAINIWLSKAPGYAVAR